MVTLHLYEGCFCSCYQVSRACALKESMNKPAKEVCPYHFFEKWSSSLFLFSPAIFVVDSPNWPQLRVACSTWKKNRFKNSVKSMCEPWASRSASSFGSWCICKRFCKRSCKAAWSLLHGLLHVGLEHLQFDCTTSLKRRKCSVTWSCSKYFVSWAEVEQEHHLTAHLHSELSAEAHRRKDNPRQEEASKQSLHQPTSRKTFQVSSVSERWHH